MEPEKQRNEQGRKRSKSEDKNKAGNSAKRNKDSEIYIHEANGAEEANNENHEVVNFMEDNNLVEMHVPGQDQEFMSDSEEEMDASFYEDRNKTSTSSNNNATCDDNIESSAESSQNLNRSRPVFVTEECLNLNEQNGKNLKDRNVLMEGEKEEIIEAACERFQKIIDQSGFMETTLLLKEHLGKLSEKDTECPATHTGKRGAELVIIERSSKRKGGVKGRIDKLLNSNSEVTIY